MKKDEALDLVVKCARMTMFATASIDRCKLATFLEQVAGEYRDLNHARMITELVKIRSSIDVVSLDEARSRVVGSAVPRVGRKS